VPLIPTSPTVPSTRVSPAAHPSRREVLPRRSDNKEVRVRASIAHFRRRKRAIWLRSVTFEEENMRSSFDRSLSKKKTCDRASIGHFRRRKRAIELRSLTFEEENARSSFDR
jgi:hypothetical protein